MGISEPLVTQVMTPTSDKNLDALEYFNLLVYEFHRDVFDSKAHYEFCREWIRFKHKALAGDVRQTLLSFFKAFVISPRHAIKRFLCSLPTLSRNWQFGAFARNTSC